MYGVLFLMHLNPPQAFLNSVPAAQALLRILVGFGDKTGEGTCRQISYAYAEGGGDGGTTCRVLRRACGSPADGVRSAPQTLVAPPQAARASEDRTQTATTMDTGAIYGVPRVQCAEERLHPVSLFSTTATTLTQHYDLVRHCIAARRDVCHAALHQHLAMPAEVWPDVSHAHRLRVFDTLVEAGHWKLLKRRGKTIKPYVPVIAVTFCLSSVLPAVPSDVLDSPLQQAVRESACQRQRGDAQGHHQQHHVFDDAWIDSPHHLEDLQVPGAQSMYAA